MTYEQLKNALRLQQIAYDLLLWINDLAATRPEILSDDRVETMRTADECASWLATTMPQFPSYLQVENDDLQKLGCLFASFLQTSFRIDQRYSAKARRVTRQFVPITAARMGTGRRAAKKDLRTAGDLQRIALDALAEDAQRGISTELVGRFMQIDEYRDDLLLWSYAWELVRRSQFASQGPAVHRMWKRMDTKTRRLLSADQIWMARQRILDGLDALASTDTKDENE